jgi:hypothetical protein
VILLAALVALAAPATARFGFHGFVAIHVAATAAWLLVARRDASTGVAIIVAVALRLLIAFEEPLCRMARRWPRA